MLKFTSSVFEFEALSEVIKSDVITSKGCSAGVGARALASHQCGSGSIPRLRHVG